MSDFNLLVIIGPTASGKTSLAVQLARQLDGEIISADSRQVYRGLDIGSGKDLHEYQTIPYHLIDIVDPGYEFSVFDFQTRFFDIFSALQAGGKLPVLAGGSALYIDSVLDGYRMIAVPENPLLRKQLTTYTHQQLTERLLLLKPKQHNTTDLQDINRLIRAIEIAEAERSTTAQLPTLPEIKPFIIGIEFPRNIIRRRITERLHQRLENGLIEEVQQLHKQGVSWETLNFYGLEYRFVAEYLQGQSSRNDMFLKLNTAIHKFAKKQRSWLRRLQSKGHVIHWVDGLKDTYQQAISIVNHPDH